MRSIPGVFPQSGHVDLVVEMADVSDDRLVFHTTHLLGGDDVPISGRRDKEVRPARSCSPAY